jgi:hypothetical protein
MLTFLDWVVQIREGLMSPQQSQGDKVCFGIHSLDGPIDVDKMRNSIEDIQGVSKGHAFVRRPPETRHRGMKKMMCKDTGLLKLATSSLHQVPDEMVIGGDKTHKLFLYMPGNYHKGMARKLDKKMMAADSATQGGTPYHNQQMQPVTDRQGQTPQPRKMMAADNTQQGQTPLALPAPPQPTHRPLQRRTRPHDIEQHDDEPQSHLAARYRNMYLSPGDPEKR